MDRKKTLHSRSQCWCWRLSNVWFTFFFISSVAISLCQGEIHFVNRDNVLEEGTPGEPLRDMVDRLEEPLAMEARLVPTFRLSPNASEEVPSMNSQPVLQFHVMKMNKQQDQDMKKKDDEEGGEDDTSEEDNVNQDEPDDEMGTTTPRYRRRLMLFGSNSEANSPSTSTLRPPKEAIIYSVPEQSFWTRDNVKYVKNKKKDATRKIEETSSSPSVSSFPSFFSNPQSSPPQELQQDERQYQSLDPSSISTSNSNSRSSRTPPDVENSTPPPPTDNVTSTSTEVPVPVISPSPSPSPAASNSNINNNNINNLNNNLNNPEGISSSFLRMALAERKYHLAQCMRYCMDAIL